MTEQISAFHQRSNGTYGAPRIFEDLRGIGVNTSKKRVARLMRQAQIYGVSRRKGIRTTHRSLTEEKAPDLVKRDFKVDKPNKLWVADITYVPTWSGFLYLSVVLDAFSRRVGLGNGQTSEDPTGLGCLGYGTLEPTTRAGDSSFRSRVSIYILCFWSTLCKDGGQAICWIGW